MKIDKDIQPKFEALLKRAPKTMGNVLGLKYLVVSKDEMKASMPVSENTIQPMGILHGGASVALAETLASVGAWLNLRDDKSATVGLEINANHIRPVPMGNKVIGTARPLHRGSKTQVWEIRIETEGGKLVSISRCTLAIIKV